ncbi:MAG: D-alanyl-D-alanine endopeptidase [Burkholderiaceae bacterium]|nr:D-alanyl-D-alanine endopeptidase [Burkholderiaceae bacterium]
MKVFVDTRTKVAAEARAPVADSARAGQARPSIGHAFGLHDVEDPLSLESAVALVLDQRSGEVLFEKNSRAVLPIASISKLMTAIVVLDAKLPLDEMLEISEADVDTERFTRSRLRTGTRLTRDELLHLALMSSENRAAHALGRHYPGGMPAFVAQMNRKAQELGMTSSGFVEPTGLSSSNVSSARDLALLVQAASRYPLIREYSTASALSVDTGRRTESYRNTNRLIDRSDWEIGVQKTGFISEAGNCVVMQARIASRPVVMVLLDAEQRTARVSDSLRIRQWVEGLGTSGVRRVTHPDDEAQQPAREPGAHNV